MWKYLFKRLLNLFVILFGVSFFIFAVTTLVTGRSTADNPDIVTSYFMRYFNWLRMIVAGSADGVDWSRRWSSLAYFGQYIPETIRLLAVSFIVVVLVSLPLGVLSALKKDSFFDYTIRFFSFFGASIPNFSLGFLLLMGFAVTLRWFPVIGEGDLLHMVLPVCALTTPIISRYIRQIRGAALEELNHDYVAGATARGVSQWRIVVFHILPNALPSVLAYLGIMIGQLLGGVIIIETVFFWRGIGNITVQSIRAQEYPVIQSYALWMAILYIVSTFTVDTVYQLMNPQFRRKEALF